MFRKIKIGFIPLLVLLFSLDLSLPARSAANLLIDSIRRVSVSSDGTQGNGHSQTPSISDDGRFVAFTSRSTNLAPGDTIGDQDIYVHDLQTGQTTLASATMPGTSDSGDSWYPSISADGRYVVFTSNSNNLVPDDHGNADVFLHDRQTGQTIRASVSQHGRELKNGSNTGSVSGDGRYVAFVYGGNDAVIYNDKNGNGVCDYIDGDICTEVAQVFLYDRLASPPNQISVASVPVGSGYFSDQCKDPDLTPDGRYVAYSSYAEHGSVTVQHIFVRDLQAGLTSEVSVSSLGVPGNDHSSQPAISDDGRYVVFASESTNLTPEGVKGFFLHDRQTNQTTLISLNQAGTPIPYVAIVSDYSAISADGRFAAFTGAVNPPTESVLYLYVRDLVAQQTILVSRRADGTSTKANSEAPSLSGDGYLVAFASLDSMLVPGSDTNRDSDSNIYVAPVIAPLTVNSTGDLGDKDTTDRLCDTGGVIQRSGQNEPECTLRAAIEQAEVNQGADFITFDVPPSTGSGNNSSTGSGTGLPTILPAQALPTVTQPLTIDGTTQPPPSPPITSYGGGQGGAVEINGQNIAAQGVPGLHITAGNSVIKGLVINRFTGSGIVLEGSGNQVKGCYIGVDSGATQARPNQQHGIEIVNASNNQIGGRGSQNRNVISANGLDGVHIRGSAARNNHIQNNIIGLDVSGEAYLGNGRHGLALVEAGDNLIGGLLSEEGNLLSKNAQHGVYISGASASSNALRGNKIGVQIDGLSPAGNGGSGVFIAAPKNSVGMASAGYGNVIAYNVSDGVTILTSATESIGNAIVGNSTFGNGAGSQFGLGIDLGDDGVTLNDEGDADTGPNLRQNYPLLTYLVTDHAAVTGTLHSMPNQTYWVELFSSESIMGNPSGHGEGKVYLGGLEVSTNAQGVGAFRYDTTAHHTNLICLTATDGNNNTSEYSRCRGVAIRDSDLKVQHLQFPEAEWVDLPASYTTVEGNTVRFQVLLENRGRLQEQVKVQFINQETGQPLPEGKKDVTIPGRETALVEYLWDTEGAAWTANSADYADGTDETDGSRQPRTQPYSIEIRALGSDPQAGEITFDIRQRQVKVNPRPVVLVHGWWSDASAWTQYPAFLKAAHPDWKGYAVGDSNFAGAMSTGKPWSFGNSIPENAEILARYIHAMRQAENAWHFDLVVHSKGGLISRYYIDRLLRKIEPDGSRALHRLVMLGTPNEGSACAYLIPGTGAVELNPLYLGFRFNPLITDRKGVPFSILFGNVMPATCVDPTPGDSVVSWRSAIGFSTPTIWISDREEHFIMHTKMTASQASFNEFVLPRLNGSLALTDAALTPPSPEKDELLHFSPLFKGGAGGAEQPQMAYFDFVSLPAGGNLTVPFSVTQALTLGVTLAAPGTVGSSLVSPSQQVTGTIAADSDLALQHFRTTRLSQPEAGLWQVKLVNTATTSATVSLAAWLQGGPRTLELVAGQADGQGRIPITATLTLSSSIGTVADTAAVAEIGDLGYSEELLVDFPVQETPLVTATLYTTGNQAYHVRLIDDGKHDDGGVGDGVYGGLSAALPGGDYLLSAQARGSGWVQYTSGQIARIAAADLQVSKTVSAGPIYSGDPLTYTVAITNAGASDAWSVLVTDTLPVSMTLLRVGSIFGDCSGAPGAVQSAQHVSGDEHLSATQDVTCTLGLSSGSTVTLTLVVQPQASGVYTNSVQVSLQGEADANAADNQDSLPVQVLPRRGKLYLPLVRRN